MTAALVVYAATFMRYSLAVTPKNYLLFACHLTNFGAQTTQGYRYLSYWKYVGSAVRATQPSLIPQIKASLEFFLANGYFFRAFVAGVDGKPSSPKRLSRVPWPPRHKKASWKSSLVLGNVYIRSRLYLATGHCISISILSLLFGGPMIGSKVRLVEVNLQGYEKG